MDTSRRMRWSASACFGGAILAVAGACDTLPVAISCNALGFAEVPANPSPVRVGEATVVPPPRWCYGPPNTATFTNLGMMGQKVPLKATPLQTANTFMALLMQFDQPDGTTVQPATLATFADEWTASGLNRMLGPAGRSRPAQTLDPRFTISARQTQPADLPGAAACRRYRMIMIEIGNPRMPNETLEIHDEGLICLGAGTPGALYVASYSERFLRGGQVAPERSRQLARDSGQPFLASLRFGN